MIYTVQWNGNSQLLSIKKVKSGMQAKENKSTEVETHILMKTKKKYRTLEIKVKIPTAMI